ncbi:MAG: hypothetical protein ACLQKA_18330 [Bryobacteraceae bacterium]
MADQNAKPTVTIDEDFFREPRFRPPQILQICRVDRDNLLDWHRRELIPDARAGTKGRGHRRLYSVRDAIYINTVRILAEVDAPLQQASLLASDMVDAVAEAFRLQWNTGSEFGELPDCAVVLYRMDGTWHHQWFGIKGRKPVPDGGLHRWMRDRFIESSVVLDINSIVFTLFDRILTEMGILPHAQQ